MIVVDLQITLQFVVQECLFVQLSLKATFINLNQKVDILLILAILVLLYSAITQISHALLDNNGNGKVPIIDPHDSDWYRLKQISRIIEYTTCTIVVIIQILIGYKKKKSFNKCQAIESLIENDNILITSLEPTTQKFNQNQVTFSQGNSHMINTFESKNTQQIQAIQKLNNNNNNNNS
ncbi:unnamed protein product [Paramecium pentaurelia]|uniref:Transmembrane protein n=1 Tax=Paramecium pentaurelia TaxID=43138 RepID=A0A8S1UY71_9CILI|nr:unnamed protein product [Paramecium pentaurelia]